MRIYYKLLFLIPVILFLSSCRSATMLEGFNVDQNLPADSSVVLIDIQGHRPVTYIQLGWDFYPAINLSSIYLYDTVLAITVSKEISELTFGTCLFAGDPWYHFPSGNPINIDPLKISEKGIYFLGSLNTETKEYTQTPDEERLLIAKTMYSDLLKSLKPINFDWPE